MAQAFDTKHYGRLLRGLRNVRGYENAASKVADLIRRNGLDITDRVYYSIERGAKMANVAEHLYICEALKPEPGYFEKAMRHESGLQVSPDET